MLKANFLIYTILLFSFLSESVIASDIRVGIPVSQAPFSFPEKRNGIEVDLAKEIFRRMGKNVIPVYVDFKDIQESLKNGKIDVALTQPKAFDSSELATSRAYIRYQNVAISLRNKGHFITRLDDIRGSKVAAFPTAKINLGQKLKNLVDNNLISYSEHSRQNALNEKLYDGSADFIFVDINVFKYGQKSLNKSQKKNNPVQIYNVFPPTFYHMAFRDKSELEKINKIIYEVKKDGTYQRILAQYVN